MSAYEGLIALLILLLVVLGLTLIQMFRLIGMLTTVKHAEHAKCIAHIAYYVGNKFAARVLEAAANDYDTALGRQQLSRISAANRVEGQSIPATWMRQRAAVMDPSLSEKDIIESIAPTFGGRG